MRRISSVDEFVDFRKRILSEKSNQYEKPILVVSAGTCGQASGANDIIRVIKRYIIERNLREKVAIRITGCHGFCEVEPFILVQPGQHLYPKLKMENVPRVIEAALGGFVDEQLVYREMPGNKIYKSQSDIPFFQKQTRTVPHLKRFFRRSTRIGL